MSEANAECVGPQSEQAGKANSCAGCPNQKKCASGEAKQADPAVAEVAEKLAKVKHIILVLSGKGGVGKSTFSAQLAFALARQGLQVGLLDVDICGPSIPRMLGLVGEEVHQSASGWSPVYVLDNLAVMSIGFMLPSADDAIIWRGPRKNGLIKQFLTDVLWNELDYLVIDTPPGTSDEHISIVQYLNGANVDGAVVVTTPQEVSMSDVRKELNFCRKTGLRVLGIVENMHHIQIPMKQAIHSHNTGVKLTDRLGNDKTKEYLEIIAAKCPELMEMCVQSELFVPQQEQQQQQLQNGDDMETDGEEVIVDLADSNSSSISNDKASTLVANTPSAMAARFNIPYLGQLPMDRHLMQACEEGESFLDRYPDSVASIPFQSIVMKIMTACDVNSSTSGSAGSGSN